MTNNKAIVIDGNAVIYRIFFALYKNKQAPNIEGFLSAFDRTLQKHLKGENYGYAVFVFDSTRDTFRKKLFSNYKANRESMPELLVNNMEAIKEKARSSGFNVVIAPKPFEGDDAVCTLARIFESKQITTSVITTDRDLLQLVSYYTSVTLNSKNKAVEHSFESFESLNDGLLPFQIPIVKAIEGDSSDNYPGVAGIGKKGALELVLRYGNLERIYENLDSLTPKQKKSLIEHKEDAYKFYDLAQTRSNLELTKNLEEYKFRTNESGSRSGKPGS